MEPSARLVEVQKQRERLQDQISDLDAEMIAAAQLLQEDAEESAAKAVREANVRLGTLLHLVVRNEYQTVEFLKEMEPLQRSIVELQKRYPGKVGSLGPLQSLSAVRLADFPRGMFVVVLGALEQIPQSERSDMDQALYRMLRDLIFGEASPVPGLRG